MVERVEVFGAGVAGLATAVALHRAGLEATVYERASEHPARGMGILLMENGLAALGRLGLRERITTAGAVASAALILAPDGRTLGRRSFSPHVGLSRPGLTAALLEALPNGTVVLGRELRRLERRGDGRHVAVLDDGQRLQGDLLVGADGQRSTMREQVSPGPSLTASGVAEMVSSIVAPDFVRELGGTLLRLRSPEGGLGVGVVPTSPESVVWYITHDTKKWPKTDTPLGGEALVAAVSSWAWPLPFLVERTDFRKSYVWHTADLDALPTFRRDDVVLVGDAAHPLLPFTTQGANSALVDAVSLARALVSSEPRGKALDRWAEHRQKSAATYLEHGRARARHFLDPASSPEDPPFPNETLVCDLETLGTEEYPHAV